MVRLLGDLYFKLLLRFILLGMKRGKVAIFDLDNTIYDTWPLRKVYTTDREVYTHARAFEQVIRWVENIDKEGYSIIFITARDYRHYLLTMKVLSKTFSYRLAKNLILVPDANLKLYYLDRIQRRRGMIEYYDDLSYNHEHGEVKFYDSVIEKVAKMKLQYFGFDFLKKMQNVD